MAQCLIVGIKNLLLVDGSTLSRNVENAIPCGVVIDKKQSSLLFVGVAQVVEHGTHKPNVGSASLPADTRKFFEIIRFNV